MNTPTDWRRYLMHLISILALVAATAGSAFAGGTTLWESREGYVGIVPRESVPDEAPPNSHPTELSDELLMTLLGSIQARDTDREKAVPLLTDGALKLLVPYLRQGLHQAGPQEDVNFIIIGLYEYLLGAKRPLLTSGRLFFQGGKLNLIIGTVRRETRTGSDSVSPDFRLVPTGSRTGAAQGEWSLVPGDRPFELARRDWVVFDTTNSVVTAPPPVAPPTTQPVATGKKGKEKSPADRLTILNELKSKGLITDDEYRAKRIEIMNNI